MALTDATKTALSAVKKIFVYVKSDAFPAAYKTDADKTDAVISLSKNNPTKIYFVEPTSQIITQGQAFGVDASWKSTVDSYMKSNDSALTKLVGADLDGINKDSFAITSDSAIGAYIDALITKLGEGTVQTIKAADASIKLAGTTTVPTIKVVTDGDTIIVDDKGIKTSLKLAWTEHSEEKREDITHHYLQLVTESGTVVSEFNGDDFINDAMVDTVTYADGYLTITWNDAAGKKPETSINLAEALKVTGISSTNETYLTVSSAPDSDKGTAYEVDPHVSADFGSLEYVSPVYDSTGAVTTPEGYNVTDGSAVGLADASAVATAINNLNAAIKREFEARVAGDNASSDTINKKIDDEIARATEAEEANAADITTNRDNIQANTDAIEVLNGDGDGSVAKAVKDAVEALDADVEGTDVTTAVGAYTDGVTQGTGVVTVGVKQEDGKVSGVTVETKVARVTQSVQPSSEADKANHTLIGDKYYDFSPFDEINPDPALALAQDVRVALEITKTNAANTAEASILEALAARDPWDDTVNFNGGSSTGGNTKPDDGTVNGANGLKNALDNDGSTTDDLSANLNGDTYGTADTQSTITAKSVELKGGTIAGSIKISTID